MSDSSDEIKCDQSSEDNDRESDIGRDESMEDSNEESTKDSDEDEESERVEKNEAARMIYSCSECTFTAASAGKVYSHKVDEHNVEKLVCNFCKFTTKNSTSMHNHKKRYCAKVKGKATGKKKMESPLYAETEQGK